MAGGANGARANDSFGSAFPCAWKLRSRVRAWPVPPQVLGIAAMIASVTELLSTIVPVLGVPIWYLGIGGPAVILIGFIAYYFLVVRFCNVQIFFNHTHRNESLLALCKTLKTYDRVPLWGVNGHVQSIYASQIRKGPTYPLRRYASPTLLIISTSYDTNYSHSSIVSS